MQGKVSQYLYYSTGSQYMHNVYIYMYMYMYVHMNGYLILCIYVYNHVYTYTYLLLPLAQIKAYILYCGSNVRIVIYILLSIKKNCMRCTMYIH